MKKVTVFQSENGNVYDTEHEAKQADIRHALWMCMYNNTHQGRTFFESAIDEILEQFNIEKK